MAGRVLDLTRLLPGPLAGLVLERLGFEVLRVLPPAGDDLARWQPATHAWLNEGKASVTLDLKSASGRERLLELVRGAEVLLESNRAGVMERLGLGYPVLSGHNPHLVYVRLAGHRDDPAAPGHDLTYLAASGLLDRLTSAWSETQLADVSGGLWAALAALDGLRRGGGFYEVYLSEAANVYGYPPIPGLGGELVAYRIYQAAAGRVALAALEPHLWTRFCTAAGRPDWLDARTDPAREENRTFHELRAFFRARDAGAWEAWGREHGLPLRALRPFTPDPLRLPWQRKEER
ncbi:CoA transferase [Oceanithermus sp.]